MFCTSLRRTRLEVRTGCARKKRLAPRVSLSRAPFLPVMLVDMEREPNKRKIEGGAEGEKRFPFLPSRLPFIPLFCSHPKSRDELAHSEGGGGGGGDTQLFGLDWCVPLNRVWF